MTLMPFLASRFACCLTLPPGAIMGIESQGMILMAENPDGSLSFIKPEKAMENGGVIS